MLFSDWLVRRGRWSRRKRKGGGWSSLRGASIEQLLFMSAFYIQTKNERQIERREK